MPLNCLTLDELRKLNDALTSIVVAGFRLEQDGHAPRFDLTPGMPVQISLGTVMPRASRPDYGEWLATQDTATTDDVPSFLKPKSTVAAPPAVGAEPVDPPPALGEVAGGGPVSAEPSRSAEVAVSPGAAKVEAQAESGGGKEVAAPEAPAAPPPGSASAMAAAASMPAPWTAAEDKTLVETVVSLMVKGMARKPAATEASKSLPGRTADACIYRAHTKAKDTINALLAEAALAQAQTETPELPTAETRPDPAAEGDAAVGGHSPAAVHADDLTAHLRGMTDRGGWSLQRDLDLLELSCAGWPASDIAREINMPDAAIKPRFDALTGLHDDEATGKKARRWTREEVLGALLVMSGKAEAA